MLDPCHDVVQSYQIKAGLFCSTLCFKEYQNDFFYLLNRLVLISTTCHIMLQGSPQVLYYQLRSDHR